MTMMREATEFTDAMMERTDDINNAVYQMCLTLLELENATDCEEQFPWNIGILEEIKDAAIQILNKNQYNVCNPGMEDNGDGRKFCGLVSCGFTKCTRHP